MTPQQEQNGPSLATQFSTIVSGINTGRHGENGNHLVQKAKKILDQLKYMPQEGLSATMHFCHVTEELSFLLSSRQESPAFHSHPDETEQLLDIHGHAQFLKSMPS